METRRTTKTTRTNSANGKSNRGTGTYRSGANAGRSGAPRKNNNKRRKRTDLPYQKIAVAGVFMMIAITCVVWATKAGKSKTVESEDESTLVIETELQKEVMIDGIRITGMSREQAKAAILEQYGWDMKVLVGDQQEEHTVRNLMEDQVTKLLDEIFTEETKEELYTLDTSGLEEAVAEEVKRLAKESDIAAENGALIGFDKDNGSFIYSPEVRGKAIDQTKLTTDLNQAIQDKKFDAVLTASMTSVDPELTMAQAKQLYKVIGTFTTKTTSNKDRNTNIQLACDALDGLIIKPGEEFSFNKTTGNRTEARGYRPAGAYVNGVLVEEPGGGVCQVSSTLYNAVVFSGLTTKERHAHSYEPSYVTPGEDAMVSYDGYAGPDMRFLNNSKDTVAIRAKFSNQTLTISIVGIPILDTGVELKMKSQKTSELDPPAPVYEEDQSLQPDEQVEVKAATMGSKWVTNLVTMKDGQVVSDEFLHNSTYKGKAATVKRNTSGVVVPKETQAPETSESIQETQNQGTEPSTGTADGGSTDATTATRPPETTVSNPTVSTEGPVGPSIAPETTATVIPSGPMNQLPTGP